MSSVVSCTTLGKEPQFCGIADLMGPTAQQLWINNNLLSLSSVE
jgi:hypothetical protein